MKTIFVFFVFSTVSAVAAAQDSQSLNVLVGKNGCSVTQFCKGDRMFSTIETSYGLHMIVQGRIGTVVEHSPILMVQLDGYGTSYIDPERANLSQRGKGVSCYANICAGLFAEARMYNESNYQPIAVKIIEVFDNGVAVVLPAIVMADYVQRPSGSSKKVLYFRIEGLSNPQELTPGEEKLMHGQIDFRHLEAHRAQNQR